MNKSKKVSKYIRLLLGCRLREVISLSGWTRTQLINELEDVYDYHMHKANLSMYINGIRPMPDQFVMYASELLEIDEGYLRGSDITLKHKKTYVDYINK